MKKLVVLLGIFAACGWMFGQTTVTVPAPDGSTIVSKNNVWSCVVPPSSGLPAGMSFDGTTLTVAKLSTTLLTLTGGTTYPAGDYLQHIDDTGNLTYTPYTPPVVGLGPAGPQGPPGQQGLQGIPGPQGPPGTGGGGSSAITCTVQMPATKVSGLQAAQVTASCPGISHTTNAASLPQPSTVPPTVNGQTVWLLDALIPADNQITVRAWLMYLNPAQTFPATTFVVKVN